jgi:transposase
VSEKGGGNLMSNQKVQNEKQIHKEAFEAYYLMGDERSIRKVAKQLGRSHSTVQVWAKSFNWEERVEVRDALIQQQFDERVKKTNDSLVDMKANFHKFLKYLIAEALQDAQQKKLKIGSVSELIRVIELDLSLLGEDDRKARSQLDALSQAITGMGGGQQFVYDGKDRIDENDEPEAD